MRLLLVKLSSLGDVVQTLPVLHDIHTQFPDARIDWVVEEAFAPLVRRAARVDRVLPLAQRRWRRSRWSRATRAERRAFDVALRREAYDAVIDCQGLVKSALVARRARLAPGGFSATFGNASELCGWEWPVRWLLQRPVPMPARIHAVARTRLLVAQALGYAGAGVLEQAPTYPWQRREPQEPPQVLLAHGTSRADNEWPMAGWVEIGRRLVQGGHRVLLPQAGAAEERMARAMAVAIDRAGVEAAGPHPALPQGGRQKDGGDVQVLPRMPLDRLLAVMEGASGLIGVDSGLAHMGVALDLPVVEIFSQPRTWRAGPLGRAHQRAVGGDRAPGVDEVWSAWQACWQARPVPALA